MEQGEIPMNTEYRQTVAGSRPADLAVVDTALRQYMLRVYNYMASGLALSGIVALLTVSSPAFFQAVFGTPLMWVVMFAPLGILFAMSAGMNKMSVTTIQVLYWLLVATMGVSISSIFVIYTAESITRVFFITAATFGAMSLWGYTTKRDLSSMGAFLFMGLVGILIASIVNIFLQSSMVHWVVSVLGVLIFTGLTAYDTQRIKADFIAHRMEGDVATKSAIMGAVSLYLDFLNLFMFLLRLMGNRQ